MTEQQQPIHAVDGAFEWPASEPPHPRNLDLASKLCTSLLPARPDTKTTTTHFPSGWSSNDVIQVSISSPAHQRHRFIVKLPRHQTSSRIAANCKAEALRTRWAAEHGFGPNVLGIDEESGGFVMEFIEGRTLTMEMITKRYLPQTVNMLRRIHGAEAIDWMRKYDPVEIVREQLRCVRERKAMRSHDVRFIEGIIDDVGERVKNHPWMPCHNDFHSHNIMLVRQASRHQPERLLAIDFEDCDLADPMWDLAYLTVNLEIEQDSYILETLYGASAEEKGRVRAYVPLAMAHCATWAALHGGLWAQHQKEIMERLRDVVGDSS